MPAMTTADLLALRGYEDIVERGRRTFIEVGGALMEIRDRKLYRETHGTFEDYVQARWDFSWQRAYQLMAASAVVQNLKHARDLPEVSSSRQAEALARVEPGRREEVWREAVARNDGAPASARLVAEVAADLAPKHDDEADRVAALFTGVFPKKAAVEVQHKDPVVISVSGKNTGKVEYYTPSRYIEAARMVLGEIDLDPATCEQAQRRVRALAYYTEADDGLLRPWAGRLWLNPPYGLDEDRRSNQGRWLAQLISEYEQGEVTAAIACVNALTDTPWFQQLWPYPICFTNHRIKFDQPDGTPLEEIKDAPRNGTAFVYMGPHVEVFRSTFSQFGAVVQRVEAK